MKKNYIILAIVLLVFFIGNAQDDSTASSEPTFGIKVGYTSTIIKVSVDDASASDEASGFYIGFFGEFRLDEKFDFQPEMHMATYYQDGETGAMLLVPLLAKYNVNEQLGLLLGPQFDYILNKEDAEGLKRIGLGLAIGASVDITENVILDTKYAFGLSDRLDGDLQDFEEYNIKARFNYFQVGLGYRF